MKQVSLVCLTSSCLFLSFSSLSLSFSILSISSSSCFLSSCSTNASLFLSFNSSWCCSSATSLGLLLVLHSLSCTYSMHAMNKETIGEDKTYLTFFRVCTNSSLFRSLSLAPITALAWFSSCSTCWMDGRSSGAFLRQRLIISMIG